MQIRAGFRISFECPSPSPMLLMLNVRPERRPDLVSPDTLHVEPGTPVRQYLDEYGNVCSRLTAAPGSVTISADFIINDGGEPDPIEPDALLHPIQDLPDDVLVFLLGSRYCETQHLLDTAWRLFGGIENGWDRVQAIVDYTHDRIGFGYQHASATRTAFEAHEGRLGVCRDYAHLAVALCRCVNIPARYCTGYLGDIGVPVMDAPMDFSAWFQAYLGGRWHTFDARWNQRRIGRILMGYGRDATDVAIATTFGAAVMTGFEVTTDELPG